MTWTLTARGRALDLLDPQPDDIDLDEIAWSLARQCRYAGDIDARGEIYSVAEHCVLISRWLEAEGHSREVCLAGLFHDAAEAYTGDITWPVQRVIFDHNPGAHAAYKYMQGRLDAIIAEKVGIEVHLFHSEAVKDADLRILIDERKQILGYNLRKWDVEERGLLPLGVELRCFSPGRAHDEFVWRAKGLGLNIPEWSP